MKFILILLFFACFSFTANGQLKTAKLFSDHMVLQRNQSIAVWGWGMKNATVKVSLNGQKVSTKADTGGNWKVFLKPMPEGGPYVMTVYSKKEKMVYSDVMLGEVWLCSGQSNMDFPTKLSIGYNNQRKVASKQAVREFNVPKKISVQPQTDLPSGKWLRADTGTIGNFNAVGYYFAVKLSQRLHVTVGIIDDSWGGTEIEDWISRDAMLASADMDSAAKELPTDTNGVKARLDKDLKDYNYHNGPVALYTADQLAAEPASFFTNWAHGGSGPWMWQNFYSYHGGGFMQKTIVIDSTYAKNSSFLKLGNTDADLSIYINGQQLKDIGKPGIYQANIPAGFLKPGENSLLIDLQSEQKNPSFFGTGLSGDVFSLYFRVADTTYNLQDNWHLMADFNKPYHYEIQPNNNGFMIYNGMINPIIPYGIEGVIWYQGESNAPRAYQYRTALPLMISDWRGRWNRQFPFLFVQLPGFGGSQGSDKGSNWAELREAQTLTTMHVPNTGMIVTTDLTDGTNLHPQNKADFGYRMAAKVLNMVYADTGYYESPMYNSADFKEGYALINFTHAENGLVIKDKYGYLKGFELAGADHKFYYAQAVIVDGNKVKVWCNQVPQPIAVRYGWTDAPVDANLFNKKGMPVNSFRSDNWKGITESNRYK